MRESDLVVTVNITKSVREVIQTVICNFLGQTIS